MTSQEGEQWGYRFLGVNGTPQPLTACPYTAYPQNSHKSGLCPMKGALNIETRLAIALGGGQAYANGQSRIEKGNSLLSISYILEAR